MTINGKNPLEKHSFFLLLLLVVWLLFGCGGSKAKLSSREQLTTTSEKHKALEMHNQTDTWQNIEVSKVAGKIVFRPLDPHKPMLTPNPNGGKIETHNAILEYSTVQSETKSNSLVKNNSGIVDHSKEKDTAQYEVKHKDVERKNIGRVFVFIIIGLFTVIVGALFFWKRKTSILGLVQNWIASVKNR